MDPNYSHLYTSLWFAITPDLDAFPVGCGVSIAPRPLCAAGDKRGPLFNKHSSSCLHVAICEAGVRGKLWLCKPYSNREGITSVPPVPGKRPAEPGGLFNTGSTPPTHLHAAEWTEIRGGKYRADQIWKCGRTCWSSSAERWSGAVIDRPAGRRSASRKKEKQADKGRVQRRGQGTPLELYNQRIHLD